jgi:hypothetical protein
MFAAKFWYKDFKEHSIEKHIHQFTQHQWKRSKVIGNYLSNLL